MPSAALVSTLKFAVVFTLINGCFVCSSMTELEAQTAQQQEQEFIDGHLRQVAEEKLKVADRIQGMSRSAGIPPDRTTAAARQGAVAAADQSAAVG